MGTIWRGGESRTAHEIEQLLYIPTFHFLKEIRMDFGLQKLSTMPKC